jgi:hypothetical protein
MSLTFPGHPAHLPWLNMSAVSYAYLYSQKIKSIQGISMDTQTLQSDTGTALTRLHPAASAAL